MIKSEKNLRIGDYIYFGKYNNEPILWRIIEKDNDRLFLFSEYIISYKCYDSKQNVEFADDYDRFHYGGNNWEKSNIRTWLNTSEREVDYRRSYPNSDKVWMGYNAYSFEPGFLSNFEESELDLIRTVVHDNLLSDFDESEKEAGSQGHVFEDAYPDIAMKNYYESNRKKVEDRVFLLSIEEVFSYVQKRDWDWIRKPNPALGCKDESLNRYGWYWLRSPVSADSHGVRVVSIDGYLAGRSAYRGTVGIVPALWIDENKVESIRGQGNKENPYILN